MRAPTAKLLETLCLAFLPADAGAAPATPAALFNAAQAEPALQAQLADEAHACLAALIDALQPGAVATATAVVVVGALASVVRARAACRERGVQALVAFAASVAASQLSASQATSLQHTLKASLAALLKQRVLDGSPLQAAVRDVLANIGARDQFEQLRRHSESASKRAAARDDDDDAAAAAASGAATAAGADDGAVKRARREASAADAYSPATYESIDDMSMHPDDAAAAEHVPAPVAGMPAFADVAACGPELLAELVLQLLAAAQIPALDVALTSTSAFSSLLARLSVVSAPTPAPAPPPAPRAAPVAQAAFRDPRRDPRLRADPASADAPAAPPDAASVVAQQLAAAMAAGAFLQPTLPLPMPAPAPVRQPMTLLPATPLKAEQSAALARRVFERLLGGEAGARHAGKARERAVLVARLAARRPPDDPLVQALLEHVAADVAHRSELASVWLTHEARAEGERYAALAEAFVQRAAKALPAKDRLLVRLCGDLPAVPPSVVRLLAALAADPERAPVAVAALREVLLLHPPARAAALEALLAASAHPDEVVRTAVVRTLATQLYLVAPRAKPAKRTAAATTGDEEREREAEREAELERAAARLSAQLSARIEEFALAAADEALSAPDAAPAPAPATGDAATAKPAAAPSDEGARPAAPASTADGGTAPAPAPVASEEEEAVRRRLALFVALAARKGELLAALVPLYGRSRAATQVLRRVVPGVVRALPPQSPALLALLADPPRRAHPLIWQVMHTATESAPASAEMRAAGQALAKRWDDPRFLVAVVGALPKEACVALLPRFVFFHDADEQTRREADAKAVLAAAFSRMLTPLPAHAAPLTPAELLVALHTMALPAAKEGAPNPLKQAADAILLCLDMRALFKQEVLAVVVQQLVDVAPIPRFLMFTVIQTAQRFPTLVSSGFVPSILAHLVRHRVWLDATLWQGMVRCCKLVAPRSFSVLLQLPEAQLADVLAKAPELREPLHKFAASNAKNVPKPLQRLLGLDADAQQARRKTQQEV